MKNLFLYVILFFSFSTYAQKSMLGKQSAELVFSKVLNFENSETTLNELGNKIVILDFWATWCAPCISSFPHLEELQEKFPNDIQIITITNETEDRINQFLENREISLAIALDEKGELSEIFPHGTIPHSVVIDQSGIVRVISTPSNITEGLIHNILNEQEVNVPEKMDVLNFDPSKPLSRSENFTFQMTITAYNSNYPCASKDKFKDSPYEGRRILASNLSARALYEIAYNYPSTVRTAVEVTDLSKFTWSHQNAICFDLIVPAELSTRRFEIMKQQLNIYFGYQVSLENRKVPVKVLRRILETNLKINESSEITEQYARNTRSGFSMKGSTIDNFADFLEGRLHVPIVDETNLHDLYDLEMNWYSESPEKLNEELEKIGLEILDEEREIRLLLIKDKK